MLKKRYLVKVVYQHVKTGAKHKILYRYVTSEHEAGAIARSLRPKYHRILLVVMGTVLDGQS